MLTIQHCPSVQRFCVRYIACCHLMHIPNSYRHCLFLNWRVEEIQWQLYTEKCWFLSANITTTCVSICGDIYWCVGFQRLFEFGTLVVYANADCQSLDNMKTVRSTAQNVFFMQFLRVGYCGFIWGVNVYGKLC